MIEFRDNREAEINNFYKPSDKIQADRRTVYDRYVRMKNGRVDRYGRSLETRWNKWLKQYESWRPDRANDDWQSNIVPPFTTTIVEKALAEIVDQTIQPMVVARGREDVDKAKLMNYIKDYTWEVGDGDLELYAALKQALVLGQTVWQEDFWSDRREVKVLSKFDFENNEEEYVKKVIKDFDDVYGENVSLFDFFIDPHARSINRGRYKADDCIRRYTMNYDSFMETFSGTLFDQFGATKYVKPGAAGSDYFEFFRPSDNVVRDNLVEVLWYWGRRPDKLIIVANDVVIRDGPNPYMHKQLPFAEGSDIPGYESFYGRGEPELLESIQDELTTSRRMRLDRQHLDIWKMFLVSNRETLDEDEAIVAPSRFLYVEDPRNSIVPLEYRDINPSAYREEELLKQDGREVTGVMSPQPTSTATEAAIHKESTQRALKLKIWHLSRGLVTNIARLRVSNIVQFYQEPKVEDIIGEARMPQFRQIRTNDVALEIGRDGSLVEKQKKGVNFFEVKPELIVPHYGGFDLKMTAEPTLPISKPLLQQKVNELSNNPVVLMAVEQGYLDAGKLADKILEVNDFDPETLKRQQEQEQTGGVDEAVLLELANRENEQLLGGKRLPPTPYATRSHTNIHLAIMESEAFKSLPRNKFEEVMNNMIYHVLGEAKAQELRGQEGGAQMSQQASVGQGIEAGEAKATNPALMLGAEGVPPVV